MCFRLFLGTNRWNQRDDGMSTPFSFCDVQKRVHFFTVCYYFCCILLSVVSLVTVDVTMIALAVVSAIVVWQKLYNYKYVVLASQVGLFVYQLLELIAFQRKLGSSKFLSICTASICQFLYENLRLLILITSPLQLLLLAILFSLTIYLAFRHDTEPADSSERVSLKSRTETETDKMLSIADQAPELLEEDVFVDVPIRTQDDSRSDEETEVF